LLGGANLRGVQPRPEAARAEGDGVKRRRILRGLGLAGALIATVALAADLVVVEDWAGPLVGTTGVPPGWQKQTWGGSPRYDFTIVEQDGQRAIQLRSASDSSNMSKDIRGKVSLAATPILEWTWKVTALPKGADGRKAATDDQAGQIYVAWPRFPQAIRSQIIGYIWDTTAPAGSVFKSQKTGTVTYVVVRSGTADLGKWLTERRDVLADFKKIYGEDPEDPGGISIGIDSDDVKGTAEAFFGRIAFRRP
jgi:hypothetical protein